jgi:hypothetical protein
VNLLTQKQFAELAKISSTAVTKARKKGRCEHYNGTVKYNVDAPLNQAFLNDLNPARIKEVQRDIIVSPDEELLDIQKKNLKAGDKLQREKAELTKQQRIKVELQNAVRRSELLEYSLVDKYIFLYLDRLHSNLERMTGAYFDDLVRKVQADGPQPEHKQEWKDLSKTAIHEAKQKIMELLEEITKEQAKK